MKKFIRKYITAKKKYEIGDIVDIEDKKLLKELLVDGTIKGFPKASNSIEKRILALEEENENLKQLLGSQKALWEGISNDVVYEILEILTVKELEKFAISKNITLEAELKEEKIKEILKAL